MAVFAGGGMIQIDPMYPAGSVEERLGVNARTGVAVIMDRANVPEDLRKYCDEFDARLPLEARRAARDSRLAAERDVETAAAHAAADQLRAGHPPDGFVVTRHTDPTAGCSAGYDLGDGYRLVRPNEVETVGGMGWHPTTWPAA